MNKRRGFSLYDIEQFLREAGAERVNEKAVISMERELQETVRELVEDASIYASYAGRSKLIKHTDVILAANGKGGQRMATRGAAIRNRIKRKRELSASYSRKRALDRMVAISAYKQQM